MPTQNEDCSGPMTSLEKLSRRAFLTGAGAAGVVTASAAVAVPLASAASAQQEAPIPEAAIPGTVPVTLRVNGETYKLQIDPRATLLDTLRETLHLTGTKKGCDHGQCGACTVHVNGRRANSCLLFAAMQQNAEITTIEGLGENGLHPVQKAWIAEDVVQCGYCQSGFIMAAAAFLKATPTPSVADIKNNVTNICRCGTYVRIRAAIHAAAAS